MPLKPFKKTREFTFPGYDGSAWTGAQLDPLYTNYRIDYDEGYIYVYNADDVNIFNIYSRGTRVDATDPAVIYNQLRIVTRDFNGVAPAIDVKITLKFNIGGSTLDLPIHIVINETKPTLTADFASLHRPSPTDWVDLHFIAIATSGNQVNTTEYLDFINAVIHPKVNYCLVSNRGLHIDSVNEIVYDDALGDKYGSYDSNPNPRYLSEAKVEQIRYDEGRSAVSISDICDFIEGYETLNELPDYWKPMPFDGGPKTTSTALVIYAPNVTIAEDSLSNDIVRLLSILREREMRLYWPVDGDSEFGDIIKKIADTEYYTAKQNYFFTSRFSAVKDIPTHPYLTATVRLDDAVNMYDRGVFTVTFDENMSANPDTWFSMCYGGNADVCSDGSLNDLFKLGRASVVYRDFSDEDEDPNGTSDAFIIPWESVVTVQIPDIIMRPYMGTVAGGWGCGGYVPESIAFSYYSRKIGGFKSWWQNLRGGEWTLEVTCIDDETIVPSVVSFDYDDNIQVMFTEYPNVTDKNIIRTFEIVAWSSVLDDGTTMTVKDTVVVDIKPFGSLEMCRYAVTGITDSSPYSEYPCSNECTSLLYDVWVTLASGSLKAIWAPIIPYNELGGYDLSPTTTPTPIVTISDLSLSVGYVMVPQSIIEGSSWIYSELWMKQSFDFFK